MTFYTGSSERLRISANGNIGIGTSSPGVKLHVIGDIGVGVSYNGGVYASTGSVSADLNWGFDFLNTSGLDDYSTRVKFYPSSGSTRKLGFWNSQLNSYMAYFDGSLNTPNFIVNAGRVGIGTTSPATILHTNTSSNVTFLGQSSSGSNTSYAYFQNAGSTSAYQVAFGSSTDDANIVAGGSERMRITAAGNAGIGTTSPGAKLEIYGSGSTGSTASLTVRNAVGTKLVNVFDDGLIQLNNLLNINQAIYINSGNSNRHYALESHIFNVVDSSFQRIDFVTIQGNLQSPAMGVGTMSPNSSAILDITSRSKGFLPPRMTNTEMNAISSPAAGLVVYDTSNNKLTVYNGSTWVPLH
jgi:hypothetical protein